MVAQPNVVQLPASSSARKLYRFKTAGTGTLAVIDFLNSSTYPASVTPATAIPAGTKIANLMDAPGSVANAATVGGASVQSAGGGFVGGAGKTVSLPAIFGLPAANNGDLHYLIILGVKPVAAAPGSSESIAGWATNTGTAQNWAIYRNAGNANYFAGVGGSFNSFGALTNAPHRLAIEVIKNGAAGTLSVNCYVDGALAATGAAVALAAIPQPAGSPALGTAGYSGSAGANEFESIEIRNLALDTADVLSIVAADWKAWSARFA